MRFNSLVLPGVAVIALSGCTKGPTCSYTVGASSISFSDNQGQWSVTGVVCDSVSLDLNPRTTVFEGSCDQMGSSDYDTYWKLVLGLYCNEQFSGLLKEKAKAVLPLSYATDFSGLSVRESCSYAEVNPFKTVSNVLSVNSCARAGTATDLDFDSCTGVTGLSGTCKSCFKDTVKSLASANGKCLDYAWTAGSYLSKCIDTVDTDLQHECGFPAPKCTREEVSGFTAVSGLFKNCGKTSTNDVLSFDTCDGIKKLSSTCNSCVKTVLSDATNSACLSSNWPASSTTAITDSVGCVVAIKTALRDQCGFTWPSCTRAETNSITDIATLMAGCTVPFTSTNTLTTTGCTKILALSSTCQTCITSALGSKATAGSGAACLSTGTYTGAACLPTVQANLANQCGFGWSFTSGR